MGIHRLRNFVYLTPDKSRSLQKGILALEHEIYEALRALTKQIDMTVSADELRCFVIFNVFTAFSFPFAHIL